jgi:hypothetical protein
MSSTTSSTDILGLKIAVDLTVKFGLRNLGALKWEPTANSEAEAELNNGEHRQSGAVWGQDPPRTAYAAANLMMTGVLDDLVSLQLLLGKQMTSLGPVVVARSAIEIASTVWWLMEPGIGGRERVCRELVLSLTSAQRAGQVAQSMQAGLAATEAAQQEAAVLQRIADLGIALPTGKRYEQIVEGQQAPTATKATTAMLTAGMAAGHSAEPVYRTYSAVTHGEFYGLMNFMVPDVLPDGSPFLRWDVNHEIVDSVIQMALFAFREAFARIHQVMGWGKLERDLWEINLGKIFNG